ARRTGGRGAIGRRARGVAAGIAGVAAGRARASGTAVVGRVVAVGADTSVHEQRQGQRPDEGQVKSKLRELHGLSLFLLESPADGHGMDEADASASAGLLIATVKPSRIDLAGAAADFGPGLDADEIFAAL